MNVKRCIFISLFVADGFESDWQHPTVPNVYSVQWILVELQNFCCCWLWRCCHGVWNVWNRFVSTFNIESFVKLCIHINKNEKFAVGIKFSWEEHCMHHAISESNLHNSNFTDATISALSQTNCASYAHQPNHKSCCTIKVHSLSIAWICKHLNGTSNQTIQSSYCLAFDLQMCWIFFSSCVFNVLISIYLSLCLCVFKIYNILFEFVRMCIDIWLFGKVNLQFE